MHEGSTIVAVRGEIGAHSALADDAPPPYGPSAPHTGSPGGYRNEEGGHPS